MTALRLTNMPELAQDIGSTCNKWRIKCQSRDGGKTFVLSKEYYYMHAQVRKGKKLPNQ